MAESVRQQRVNQAILRTVSVIILREYGDSSIGNVIVSRVKVSPDLRFATVYYKLLSEATPKALVDEALKSEIRHIRFLLAKEINHLKNVPDLTFVFDTEIDKMMKMEALFDSIKKEKHD